MQTKVIIQDDAFNRAVATAAKSLNQDFPSVMRDELGRLMQNIIDVRAPPKTKSQGLKVIRGQILNTTNPVSDRWLNILEARYGVSRARGTYKFASGVQVEFEYGLIIRDIGELHRWHQSRRNPRTGRTKYNPTKGYVTPDKAFVSKTLFNKYVKFMQKGLGMAKGGWWRAARQVYTRRAPAAWITKKIGQGRAVVDLRPGPKQTFIAENISPWADRVSEGNRAVNEALAARSKIIPQAVERALKRAAKNAGLQASGTDIKNATVTK